MHAPPPKFSRYGGAFAPTLRCLRLESIGIRVPDRGRRFFVHSGTQRLAPIGRPSDPFGDVVVSVPRIRFAEASPP